MEGVFHGVQVIQVAPELVEAVDGRQKLVAITEMIFAELARCVAHRFQHCCNGRRLRRYPDGGTSLSDGREAGSNREFAGDEVRASGGTTRFRIIVGEAHALVGHLVQMRRSTGHDALIVDTNVRLADVIAHDDDDVRSLP
jgi:hypothetical protein